MNYEDVRAVHEPGFYTAAGVVATEPFRSRTPDISGGGRGPSRDRQGRPGMDHVAIAEYNRALVRLRVVLPSANGVIRPDPHRWVRDSEDDTKVFGGHDVPQALYVWVEERNKAADWGKSVMTYHDTPYILVPEAEIRGWEREDLPEANPKPEPESGVHGVI